MANSVLDMFSDELRDFLFKKRAPDQEYLADKGMDESYLSEMRFPLLQKKQAWGWEGAGYRLVIARGISGHEDINLINVELKKFKFEAKQGGSVDVEFQAKGHPSGEDVGSLFEELGEEVDLTLEPPSAEKLAQMELDSQREDEDEYDEDDDHFNGAASTDQDDEATSGVSAEETEAALQEALSGDDEDQLYQEAVKIVIATKNATISYIQRGLRIGYNRAARLIERMEAEAVVSEPDESGRREVLQSAA